jgi:hypothetical protein
MLKLVIDPNKWVKLSDAKLEQNQAYWFKKTDGVIVMGAPYSTGYASGIAVCAMDDTGLHILTNTFYILKNALVQPVVYK